jgi:hypothetical protein
MQDGASPHRAESTTEWLEDNDVTKIEWPTYSPDANIMENIWGNMARLVYADGRTYATEEELWESIAEVWEGLSRDGDMICKLFDSMPRRLKLIEDTSGGPIDY